MPPSHCGDTGGCDVGDVGQIVNIVSVGRVSISFTEFRSGRHNAGGMAKEGHGWNLPTGILELVDKPNSEPSSKRREW